jgi:hypothetical protein
MERLLDDLLAHTGLRRQVHLRARGSGPEQHSTDGHAPPGDSAAALLHPARGLGGLVQALSPADDRATLPHLDDGHQRVRQGSCRERDAGVVDDEQQASALAVALHDVEFPLNLAWSGRRIANEGAQAEHFAVHCDVDAGPVQVVGLDAEVIEEGHAVRQSGTHGLTLQV